MQVSKVRLRPRAASNVPRRPRAGARGGSAMIEFALSMLILVPMILGVFVVGWNLTRDIQIIQINRDIGHLFARSTDFGTAAGRDFAQRLASGFDLSADGDMVIILSQVTFVSQADCTAAGLTLSDCVNHDQVVITKRILLGNQSKTGKFVSRFGMPDAADFAADGTSITRTAQLRDASTRAVDFATTMMALQQNDYAYLVEVRLPTPDMNIPGFLTNTEVYSVAVF